MTRQLFISFLAAIVVGGCASDIATHADTKEVKEYVTGSNIPRRDKDNNGVTVQSREAVEQMQRSGGSGRGSEGVPVLR